MKNYIFIIVFIFTQKGFSQEDTILWEIKKDSVISYLFGTQHLFGNKFLNENQLIKDCISRCKEVLIENNNSFDSIINNRTENNYIKDLTDEHRKMIFMFFKGKVSSINKLSLKECLLQTDKYWSKLSCLSSKEINDTLTLDESIKKYAIINKIKVKGLENLTETINYINKFTYIDIEDSKLNDILIYKLNLILQNTKHKNCEIEKLYKKKTYFYNLEKKVEVPIITDRNKNWMESIPILLQKYKNVFIAVGIAHLDFELGLINQLKQKGYIITPIKL